MTAQTSDIYPVERLSPDACAVIARALAKAIAVFEQWAIPVPDTGRLLEARRWLEDVAKRGHYGESDEELLRTGRAVTLAVDFYHISTTLGDERDDSLAKEIALSLGGTLEGKTRDSIRTIFRVSSGWARFSRSRVCTRKCWAASGKG
jgi:hypothetical protein